MRRSVRWLDRCADFHQGAGRDTTQNLFAIVQGGLDPTLRDECLDEMIARKDRVAGFAIGGLSGGEEKGMLLFGRYEMNLICFQMFFGECLLHFSSLMLLTDATRSIKQCADKLPEDRESLFSHALGLDLKEIRSTLLYGHWIC
jgi:hypothetical protein